MGKKLKKSARKKKDGAEDMEDLAWLTRKSTMAAAETAGSSSKQVCPNKPTLPIDGDCADDTTSPISVSKTCVDSVKNGVVEPVLQIPGAVALKNAVQVFDESPEPNSSAQIYPKIAGIVGKEASDSCDSSPSISRTLGDEDSVESKGQEIAGADSSKQADLPAANSTWASLFRSNRGLSENLLLNECLDENVKVQLKPTDMDVIELQWGFGLIGYVAGKFPGKAAIDRCCKSWGVRFQLHFHSSGWLLLKFRSETDRDLVLKNGPYYIFGRPLLLKIIPELFNFNDHEISKVPVWVQLPNLPLELWNVRALSKIASKLGTPKQADKLTISRERVSYARVLVEVDVTKPLKEAVCISVPSGKEFEQAVRYEFVPKFCTACKAIGHSNDRCPYSNNAAVAKPVAKPASGKSNDGPKITATKPAYVPVAVNVSSIDLVPSSSSSRNQPVSAEVLPSAQLAVVPDPANKSHSAAIPPPAGLAAAPAPAIDSGICADAEEAPFVEVTRRAKAKGKQNLVAGTNSDQPIPGIKTKKHGKEKLHPILATVGKKKGAAPLTTQ